MNNEIKEILYLQDYIDKYKSDEKAIINGNRLTTPAMLDYLEAKELLDYITNLQEENKQLRWESNHNYNLGKDIDKEARKYKSRIDKAIEYIKNDWYELNTRDIEHVVNLGKDIRIDLLNILQGEDKDK